jgi:CheY-like chemotaxis protein
LLDIGLPSMDGYEVASRLRAAGIDATLVALTGYGQKDDIERALRAGFNAHLAKPVEFAKLEELLRDIAASKTPSTAAR